MKAKNFFTVMTSTDSQERRRPDGIENSPHQITMRPTKHGIEITISSPLTIKPLLLMLLGLLGAGIGIILPFLDKYLSRNPSLDLSILCLFGGVQLFLCSVILVGKAWQQLDWGQEKLVISKHRMLFESKTIGKIFQRWHDLQDIPEVKVGKATFLLNNGTPYKVFGKFVTDAEAQHLVRQIRDILAFRCQSVEQIIFGNVPEAKTHDPLLTLMNPDTSALSVPFLFLKQVVIDVETYDFHHVEHFLTYAVNTLGQEYLKQQVEVHLYGESEKLHSNLRNNFSNLCKRVYVHHPTTTRRDIWDTCSVECYTEKGGRNNEKS